MNSQAGEPSKAWSQLRNNLPIRKRNLERRRLSSTTGSNASGVPEISLTRPMEDEEDSDDEMPFISIGIDLGTTYSGVAWAQSTSPGQVNIVRSWESSDLTRIHDNHKVPSILTYSKISKEVTSWGYNLKERKHHFPWFKLLLSTQAEEMLKRAKPEDYAGLKKNLKDYDKSALDVAADYLRCLWNHAQKEIMKIGKDLWEYSNLRIVITVPAIWDYEAQQLTRKAAKMAGLLDKEGTTLELVGEPEAAALSVFDELESAKRRLKVGDPFVVCDAGGGTVDLISYIINDLKPLRLTMCNEARGDFCGGVFIDAGFEKLVDRIVGNQERNIGKSAWREMLNHWEFGVKRELRVDFPQDKILNVALRGYAGTGTKRPKSPLRVSTASEVSAYDFDALDDESDAGFLSLKAGDLQKIFSEQCSIIKRLVQEQVDGVKKKQKRLPKAILLVGGFGQNEYLRQELVRSFPNIEIQRPINAWVAICRGAVLKGLGNEVVLNHVSGYNYGTLFIEDFDKSRHSKMDRNFDKDQGKDVAENQIDWFLYKGDNIEKNKPISHPFLFRVWNREEMKLKTFHIYYSETPRKNVEQRKEPTVKMLCTLLMSFDPSIYDELPRYRSTKGGEYGELEFGLEMRVTSGEICWSTKYKGVEIGSVRSKIGQEGRTVDAPLDYKS